MRKIQLKDTKPHHSVVNSIINLLSPTLLLSISGRSILWTCVRTGRRKSKWWVAIRMRKSAKFNLYLEYDQTQASWWGYEQSDLFSCILFVLFFFIHTTQHHTLLSFISTNHQSSEDSPSIPYCITSYYTTPHIAQLTATLLSLPPLRRHLLLNPSSSPTQSLILSYSIPHPAPSPVQPVDHIHRFTQLAPPHNCVEQIPPSKHMETSSEKK